MNLTFSNMENLAETDLVWFFNHSQADMGVKSNWVAMVSAACFGGSTTSYHDHTSSFILNSVGQFRTLEKVYKVLSSTTQDILFASFADIHIGENINKVFKKHAGAACCNSTITPETLEDICQRSLKGQATKEDKLIISKIRMQATKDYQESINAYIHCKYELSKKMRNEHV
jgi:hypothetical protein